MILASDIQRHLLSIKSAKPFLETYVMCSSDVIPWLLQVGVNVSL
jgi:hypothetical protein